MPAQSTTRGPRRESQAADAAARLAAIARASVPSTGSPGSGGSGGWVPAEPVLPDVADVRIDDGDDVHDLLLDLRDNPFEDADTHDRRRPRHTAPPARDDLDGWRQRALDRLPVTIRDSRWAVPLTAVAALLAVVGLVGTVVAVRTAAATPGIPVPARSATAPAGSGPSTPPSTSTSSTTGVVGVAPSPAPVEQSGGGQEALVVHVVGQVRRPGVVRLPAGSRVDDAVAAAGGALHGADLTRVNLARALVDGEQLFLPKPGEEIPAQIAEPPAGGGQGEPAAGGQGAGAGAGQGALLDINTATSAQLEELPGVGPVLAGRVIEWREQNGRFSSVDELGEVSGIGPKVLERLRPLVTV
ncbi:MAG TPA: ComEA family DNA-binding protein [Actinomycetales bacterium]|nr:ComEA family DNA-binding protein [Actinomycetales bacterium]